MSFVDTYKKRKNYAKEFSFALDCVIKPNQIRILTDTSSEKEVIVRGLTKEQSQKLQYYFKNGKKVVQNGFVSCAIHSKLIPNDYEQIFQAPISQKVLDFLRKK